MDPRKQHRAPDRYALQESSPCRNVRLPPVRGASQSFISSQGSGVFPSEGTKHQFTQFEGPSPPAKKSVPEASKSYDFASAGNSPERLDALYRLLGKHRFIVVPDREVNPIDNMPLFSIMQSRASPDPSGKSKEMLKRRHIQSNFMRRFVGAAFYRYTSNKAYRHIKHEYPKSFSVDQKHHVYEFLNNSEINSLRKGSEWLKTPKQQKETGSRKLFRQNAMTVNEYYDTSGSGTKKTMKGGSERWQQGQEFAEQYEMEKRKLEETIMHRNERLKTLMKVLSFTAK